MNKKYYDLLGVTEEMSDEQIAERYEQLKKKYSEDRFLEGEAGNEAAKMLNKIDVAYNEIMTERRENRSAGNSNSSYTQVDQLIRDGKFAEAQAALDEFNERPAEWHYLQSVVFYRKNWMNESKKQLEIALQMDPKNEKYKTAYQKLKEKIEYDKRKAEKPENVPGSQNAGYNGQNNNAQPDYDQPQMGGGSGLCEQCATCCACNVLLNCCMNACCGCR